MQCYLERICEQFEVDWKPRVKLTSSELVEPMVAPSGYSVGAGQGTGKCNDFVPDWINFAKCLFACIQNMLFFLDHYWAIQV